MAGIINVPPEMFGGLQAFLDAPLGTGTTVTVGMALVGFAGLLILMYILKDD